MRRALSACDLYLEGVYETHAADYLNGRNAYDGERNFTASE
jgi:hypothetical protein